MVKNLPLQSLGGEEPLEKEMATYSRILAWEIAWTEELGGPRRPQSLESQTAAILRLILTTLMHSWFHSISYNRFSPNYNLYI